MPETEWVHLDVKRIVRETPKAFLLMLEDGSEHWIPKNQIADPDNYDQGDENCTVSISEWIAQQKDLPP